MKENGSREGNGRGNVQCLVCNQATVEAFLDLGQTALANKFLKAEELELGEPTYPLRVGFCHTCAHVQLIEVVPPQVMFEDYLYMSSASDALKDHLYDLSDVVVDRYHLGAKDLVVDIGCNDTTLLSGFVRHGVRVLGVDPAANLADLTRRNGIDRLVAFFSKGTAQEIVDRWGQATVITTTNTFPHIPQLQDFIKGLKTVLKPGGVLVIEAHYLVDLLEQGAFDTIYHEHVSYWALAPMIYLFEKAEMDVVDVERLPLHHGQLRVFVQRKGEGQVQPSVKKLLETERSLELNLFDTYRRFAETTRKIKTDLHATIRDLHAAGKKLAGYGAPAKGNTLLSFLEIGPEYLHFIADRSSLKQGLYTPGLHVPVVSPERLLTDQPDYVLLLAWNFADEIVRQQAEYLSRGGKFIVPVPAVRILS